MRRMFTDKITTSDAFLDMPLTTQALYFHLCMSADDDGFVNRPKGIQRTIGASDDDLKLLYAKRFILAFESGVIVIKHWRMHNLLRKDRYKETDYLEEKAELKLKENGSYTEKTDVVAKGLPSGCQTVAPSKVKLSKDSKEKPYISKDIYGKEKKAIEIPPSVDEVKEYCKERNNSIDAELFIDYYQARGWVLTNGKKMKDWKAAVRTWERNRKERTNETVGAVGKGSEQSEQSSQDARDYGW